MKTLINNAHVISPDVDIDRASVLIDDKTIAAIYRPSDETPSDVDAIVNAKERMLVPGFIDVHVHGRSGHDFCDATLDGVVAIAKAKIEDGVTSLLPTTLAVSEDQLTRSLQTATDYVNTQQAGAKLLGVHLEGPFFTPEYAGAQNPEFLRKPDIELVKKLHSIFPIKVVSYSIELPHSAEFARQLCDMGIMPSCAHSAGTYADFKKAWENGLKHMAHFCNVITPLHHLEIGLVGGALLHKDVFVELICDGIHLCPEMIQLLFQIKGPDRIMLVTDAIRAAAMPDGQYDLSGLKVIVRNGCARLTSGKVAGSTLLYYQGLRNVHKITGLPLKELIKTTSWNQARSLGLGKLGKIAAGYIADIVLLNDDFSPNAVWIDGELKESTDGHPPVSHNRKPNPQSNDCAR